jgi:hypothetical protein
MCERCWINNRGQLGDHGDGLQSLVDVPVPVRLASEAAELTACCYCGEPTIFGVYVRQDPAEVSCGGQHP